MLTASNVPMEEMDEFPKMLFDTLHRLVEQNDIDMHRMATVIEKEMLKLLDGIETDAHDTAAAICISGKYIQCVFHVLNTLTQKHGYNRFPLWRA